MKLELLLNPISDKNYIIEETNKKVCILGDTLRGSFEKYMTSLELKEYAPNFIVQRNGFIHKLYDDKYYSNINPKEIINKNSIFIFFDNAGLVEKNGDNFVNWCDDIIPDNEVIEHNHNYYHLYTLEQTKSVGLLLRYLSNKHNIEIKPLTHDYHENNVIMLKTFDEFSYSPNETIDLNYLNDIIFSL